MYNNNHRNVELSPSQIIEKRCNRVGSEDFRAAARMLRYAEHDGYRGGDLLTATNLAQGLEVAIEMSERGDHEAASKQASNCLWTLGKNRELARAQNRKSLGSMFIECRDGNKRKLGDMVEWYISVHGRIHKQLVEARVAEIKAKEQREAELLAAEMEIIEFSASVAAGTAQLDDVDSKVQRVKAA